MVLAWKNIFMPFWHIKDNDYYKLAKIAGQFNDDFRFAWEKASGRDLLGAGLSTQYVEQVLALRQKLDLSRSMQQLWEADIVPLGRNRAEFPKELSSLEYLPFLLYRKGASLESLPRRVAVVGTRKSTIWGEKTAFRLGKSLCEAGMSVVSGLAFGIDACAHTGALEATGKTLGILASGIAQVTPSTHKMLAQKILVQGGAIISEYPVTSPAFKYRFLERNRLISGLSVGVVVVEAAKNSGALITAGKAADQQKAIWVFPGDPGKPSSAGCNNAIKAGATLVDSISEVVTLAEKRLRDTGEEFEDNNVQQGTQSLLELIRLRHRSSEELQMLSRLEWDVLLQSLSQLEITGTIGKDQNLKWKLLSD